MGRYLDFIDFQKDPPFAISSAYKKLIVFGTGQPSLS
jgi:hypothetical protein